MDVIELRRDLHAHPEVGFTEFRTASRVVEELQALGYHVSYGPDAMVPESRRGVPAHAAAAPEKGRNALLGAATALLNIHALPRYSTGSTRVNVGVLEGGSAANIIPDSARMVLECRAASYEDNQDLERRVRDILQHSAAMHGLTCSIETIGEAAKPRTSFLARPSLPRIITRSLTLMSEFCLRLSNF